MMEHQIPKYHTFGSNTIFGDKGPNRSKRKPQTKCCKEALALHDGTSSWSPWDPGIKICTFDSMRFYLLKAQISSDSKATLEISNTLRVSLINQDASLENCPSEKITKRSDSVRIIFINQI